MTVGLQVLPKKPDPHPTVLIVFYAYFQPKLRIFLRLPLLQRKSAFPLSKGLVSRKEKNKQTCFSCYVFVCYWSKMNPSELIDTNNPRSYFKPCKSNWAPTNLLSCRIFAEGGHHNLLHVMNRWARMVGWWGLDPLSDRVSFCSKDSFVRQARKGSRSIWRDSKRSVVQGETRRQREMLTVVGEIRSSYLRRRRRRARDVKEQSVSGDIHV